MHIMFTCGIKAAQTAKFNQKRTGLWGELSPMACVIDIHLPMTGATGPTVGGFPMVVDPCAVEPPPAGVYVQGGLSQYTSVG